MLIDLDFTNPECLEKFKQQFRPEFWNDIFYKIQDGIHCFGFSNEGKDVVVFGALPLSPGVYESVGIDDHNFMNDVFGAEAWSFETFKSKGITEFHDMMHYQGVLPDYGVADSWQQVLMKKPEYIQCEDKYVLFVSEVRREHQSPKGGWRYHKWGEYIGEQGPQHEYLYDDTHIDSVMLYHFFRIP
jgi:hypothetical protein